MKKKAHNYITFLKLIIVFILLVLGYLNQDKIIETGNKIYNASEQLSKNEKFNFTSSNIIYNLEENISEKPIIIFCPSNECLELLNLSFSNAQEEIKCAFYELDNLELTQTLLEKSKNPNNNNNHINISLVIEDDYLDEDSLNILYNTSINIYSNLGISSKYMHNKFCIIDNEILITGSTNPTNNGIFKNNNNIIKLTSKYLSKNYENEFDQLSSGIYSTKKISVLEYNNISLNFIYGENKGENENGNENIQSQSHSQSYEISSYFCPQDDCKKETINIINLAQEEILFANFALTLDELKEALQTKSKEGVKIEGIVEKRNINLQGSDIKELNQSFPIHEDKNKYNMHHKFFIIDETYVITGSMNPSNNGVKYNDENVLIIKNQELALKFKEEFYNMLK